MPKRVYNIGDIIDGGRAPPHDELPDGLTVKWRRKATSPTAKPAEYVWDSTPATITTPERKWFAKTDGSGGYSNSLCGFPDFEFLVVPPITPPESITVRNITLVTYAAVRVTPAVPANEEGKGAVPEKTTVLKVFPPMEAKTAEEYREFVLKTMSECAGAADVPPSQVFVLQATMGELSPVTI